MRAHTIAVTSPRLGLGTTTTAITFAETLTEYLDARTLVIDADCITLQMSSYLEALEYSPLVSAVHESIWSAISMPVEYSFDLFSPIRRREPAFARVEGSELNSIMKSFDESFANLIRETWIDSYDVIIADFPCDARNYLPKTFALFDHRLNVLVNDKALLVDYCPSEGDYLIINESNQRGERYPNQIGDLPSSRADLSETGFSVTSWKNDPAYRSSMEQAVKSFVRTAQIQ